MTVLKTILFVVVVAFFLWVFFGFIDWGRKQWREIEDDERRQAECPTLRARGGN